MAHRFGTVPSFRDRSRQGNDGMRAQDSNMENNT